MRPPLSVSNASARWRLAALPLAFASLVALGFACLAWRYSGHRSMLLGMGACGLAVFIAGSAFAFRDRLGARLVRVRLDDDGLRVEQGGRSTRIDLAQVRDVRIRDAFPLEAITLRLADGSRLALAFAHRNALTRLRSPMLAQLLERLPDASVPARAPRLGGDIGMLPWWARCPELMAIPLFAVAGIVIALSCFTMAMLWPAVFDMPPWWIAVSTCGGGMLIGAMTFLAIRIRRSPPDVRLWKGVLLVRCKRRGRFIERCHPLDGVAGVRYSRALGRRRRVCLFAIELRGVLSTRALRITFPAQSSQAVLGALRWPRNDECL